MAIKDMKGTVSTTGMINQKPSAVKPANLSGMNKLFSKKSKTTQKKPETTKTAQAQPAKTNLQDNVKNLTAEDKATLSLVLSPSVSNVLKKLAPDLEPVIQAAGKQEENLIIPVSIVKNFATKRYGGQDDKEAVTSFLSDLQESSQMDQQPVPPDTQMANADSMIKSEIDEIDSGEVDPSISPQTMETQQVQSYPYP